MYLYTPQFFTLPCDSSTAERVSTSTSQLNILQLNLFALTSFFNNSWPRALTPYSILYLDAIPFFQNTES